MTRFKAFEIADGRRIYVDPAAVSSVYDQPRDIIRKGGWTPITAAAIPNDATGDGKGNWWNDDLYTEQRPATCVIAVGTQALVVPYTADEVMRMLFDA